MRPHRALIVCLVGLIGALYALPARAAPTDAEVDARLAFIETRLEAGAPAANRWSYGWLGTYGTLSLLQAGVALGTTDPKLRRDAAVGAFSASLGIIPFGLLPFAPRFAADQLRVWPDGTPAERRRKLARGEALLKKSADAEKFGRSWVPHLLGNSVTIAWGIVLAVGYHHVASGIITAAVGTHIVELQIWTQPTAAIYDWDEYSKWSTRHPTHAEGASLSIVPAEGGIGLVTRFH